MSLQALELVPRSFKWAPPGVPSRYVSAKAMTTAAFPSAAALILFTLVGRYTSPSLDSLMSPNPKVYRKRTFTLPASAPNFSTPDVAALIAALQQATAGRDATFSDKARQRWHEQHPCAPSLKFACPL